MKSINKLSIRFSGLFISLAVAGIAVAGPAYAYNEVNGTMSSESNALASIVTPAQASAQTVTIANFAFTPQTISVNAGDTVTWVNQDSVTHTVTSTDNGPLNSGNLAPGQSYSHTFAAGGSFSYHCSIHPMMTGSVSVAAAMSSTPVPASSPRVMTGTNQQQPSPTPIQRANIPPPSPLPSSQTPILPVTGPNSGIGLAAGISLLILVLANYGKINKQN